MIYLLFISFPLGMSAVIRMLTSVFVGEEDRDSILDLVRITLTSVLAVTLAIGAAVFIMSDDLAALYFPDLSSDVFELTRQLLAVFAVSIPLVLVTSCTSDFFQAVGHIAFVNVISISDGFLAMVIPTLFLAPLLGARGVWIALFVGSVAVALLEAFYSVLRCRSFCGHFPRKLDEWLLLPLVFREDDNPRMTFTLREMEDISRVAEEAEQFCKNNGADRRTAYYSALCLEEMARNIIQHGFGDDPQHGTGGRQAGGAPAQSSAGAAKREASKAVAQHPGRGAGAAKREASKAVAQHPGRGAGQHTTRAIHPHRARRLLKKHSIQVVIVTQPENIVLRIKDDCRPFNPVERARLASGEDPVAHIGIRMVFRLAEEVDYQNLLGLNVLTIRLPRDPGAASRKG